MAVTDLAHAREIIVGWNLYPVALHQRLGDHRRDQLRPLVKDVMLEQVGRHRIPLLHGATQRRAEAQRRRCASHGRADGLRRPANAEPVTRRHRAPDGPVVSAPASDHLVGVRLAPDRAVVELSQLECRLVRLRTTGSERRGAQAARGQVDQALGQAEHDVGLKVDRAGVVEPRKLPAHRRGKVGMPVTQSSGPGEPTREVDVLLAVDVEHMTSLAASQDHRAVALHHILCDQRPDI